MKEQARLEELNAARSKVLAAFSSEKIYEDQRDELINKINSCFHLNFNVDYEISQYDSYNQWETYYIDKYGEEIAYRLLDHEYWIGMTEEQLIECKGQPNKIEKEVLKTKVKFI